MVEVHRKYDEEAPQTGPHIDNKISNKKECADRRLLSNESIANECVCCHLISCIVSIRDIANKLRVEMNE